MYSVSVGISTTAEILARLLTNFYCQIICGQTNEFEFQMTRQQTKARNTTICYRKKQIDVTL